MLFLHKRALISLVAVALFFAVGTFDARSEATDGFYVDKDGVKRTYFYITSVEFKIIAAAHKALLNHNRKWKGKDYDINFAETKDAYKVIFLPRQLTDEEKKKAQADSPFELVFDAISPIDMATEIELEKGTLKTLYSGPVRQ